MAFIRSANPLIPCAVICLALSAGAQGARRAAAGAHAREAVRSFLTFHLANDKGFTERNVRRRRRWLTPELYRLLLSELRRESLRSRLSDEAPCVNGDPFTNSQEYPSSFRVGPARPLGGKVRVDVVLVWKLGTGALDEKQIGMELSRRAGTWRIDNVLGRDGEDLVSLLRTVCPRE